MTADIQPASRLAQVQTPVIPVLGRLIQETPGCLNLGQGMVSWGPPPEVRAALASVATQAGAWESGQPSPDLDPYGPVAGDPSLLAAIAWHLQERHGFDPGLSTVMVTAGSNMAFQALAQVICDPGDEVLLPVPYYFNHAMAVQLAGGVPRPVQAGVQVDPACLEAAVGPRTRAVVTISPNNPSGAVLDRDRLTAINRLCARHRLMHIHDEAYAAFHHGGPEVWSPRSLPGSEGHTAILQSLSKSHGMAGWRVGWMVVPRSLQADLAKVQDTALICPPRLSQQAAAVALQGDWAWMEAPMAALRSRRQRVLERLDRRDRPWRLLAPADGAFYVLLELDSSLSADQAMERLVREHGVAVVSGSSFGLEGCCLRVSYGMLTGTALHGAIERLVGGLEALALAAGASASS
jgi:aspartate/methionine/tyrosine aminotransferase